MSFSYYKNILVLIITIILLLSPGYVLAQFSWFHHDKPPATPKKKALPLHYIIRGLTGAPLQNVVNRLQLIAEELETPLTPDSVQAFYRQSPDNITRALEPYGYFKPSIQKRLDRKGNGYWLTFDIDHGPLLKIRHVRVKIIGDGADDPKLINLLNNFPLKSGDPLKTKRYNLAKEEFYNIAQAEGYLDGHLTVHTIKVDMVRYVADIDLTFDTGPRYYFGTVRFSRTPYAQTFLQRYLPFQTGEPYSSVKLMKLQGNLSQTPYFQSVNIKPGRNQAEPQTLQPKDIPIYIQLKPRKSQLYSFGVGYGTDTGARGSFGYELRNITPYGDYFQAAAQVSRIQSTFQTRYVIPGKNPITDHYSLLAGIATNQPGDGEYTTFESGGSYVTQVWGFRQRISLTYQRERFQVDSWSPFFITHYLVPNISWERIQTDDRVNTNNGYRIFLNLQGGKSLTSNNLFGQSELQAKLIRSIGTSQRFIFRTDLGFTEMQSLTTLPLSMRYFAGGSTSVRGFSYQSLGPGRYLIVGSGEYQHRIYKKWYWAWFYDAGNAFDNTPIMLNQSVGTGVVWRSPLGPIELTIARPLENANPVFIKSVKVQFVMGPDL